MENEKTLKVKITGSVAERFEAMKEEFRDTFNAADENEIARALLIMGLNELDKEVGVAQ